MADLQNSSGKPSIKIRLWQGTGSLMSIVYGLVLVKWGNFIPTWLILALASIVVGLLVASGILHMRGIGFSKSFHAHPFAYVAAIVMCCCVAVGTSVYLLVRPQRKGAEVSHQTATVVSKEGAERKDSESKVLPTSPSERSSRSAPTSPHSKVPTTQHPAAPPKALTQQPVASFPASPAIIPTTTQQCAPGSQCNTANGGGTITNPTVYNLKDPPPTVEGLVIQELKPVPPFEIIPNDPNREMRVMNYNNALGMEVGAKPLTELPGLVLSFHMSSSFVSPNFIVGCNAPAEITSESVSGSDGKGTFFSTSGLPPVLSPRDGVRITIRFKDAKNPCTAANVKPSP